MCMLRDRPFNLQGGVGVMFFFLFRNFFSDTTRVRIFIFFCCVKGEICFQNLTLGYMTKTLNQIIFFPPPKSEYFFSNIGNQNIFLGKKHNPPFQVKWSFPYLLLYGDLHSIRAI